MFEIKESEITDFYSTDWEVTKIRHSSACFNSYNNRNLEKYLKLIVKGSKPVKEESVTFYLRKLEELETTEIKNILSQDEFNVVKGEEPHDLLFRACINNLHKYKLDGTVMV